MLIAAEMPFAQTVTMKFWKPWEVGIRPRAEGGLDEGGALDGGKIAGEASSGGELAAAAGKAVPAEQESSDRVRRNIGADVELAADDPCAGEREGKASVKVVNE